MKMDFIVLIKPFSPARWEVKRVSRIIFIMEHVLEYVFRVEPEPGLDDVQFFMAIWNCNITINPFASNLTSI